MRYRPIVLAASALLLVSTLAVAQQEESAEARLVATMSLAAGSPEIATRAAELEAERDMFRSSTGSPPITLEVQREGFKGFFQDQHNAIGYLRARLPFTAPWQSGSIGSLDEQVRAWIGPQTRADLLEQMASLGVSWLELAAETERVAVLERRVERMDRALVIQQRRLQLGEVSGAEVTQLELERLNDLSRATEARARVLALGGRLRALAGTETLPPRVGDLASLLEASRTLPGDLAVAEAVNRSAAVRAARERAAAEARWGDALADTVWGRPDLALELEHVPAVAGFDSYVGWGFLLSFPLHTGGAGSARVAEARARTRGLEARVRQVVLDVERDVREARAVAEAATESLEAMLPMLGRLQEIEFSLGEQFRLGSISYLVYIDGLSRLDEARLQAIASRLNVLAARLRTAALLDDSTIFPLPSEP